LSDANVPKLGAIITDYGNERIHNHCQQHNSEVLNSSSVKKMLTEHILLCYNSVREKKGTSSVETKLISFRSTGTSERKCKLCFDWWHTFLPLQKYYTHTVF